MTDVSSSSHGRRRHRAVRLAAAAAGLLGAMGVAGCGIQPSAERVVGAAPTLQAANDDNGTESSGSGENQYELYFFRDGNVTSVMRYTNDTVTQELVLQELIGGPSSTESSEGFSSAIPDNLSVVSYTADNQQWNYQYSDSLSMAEKAEIVCTLQADLNAPSVGTYEPGEQHWNNCFDFTEDYGAPAYPGDLASASATPGDTDSGD